VYEKTAPLSDYSDRYIVSPSTPATRLRALTLHGAYLDLSLLPQGFTMHGSFAEFVALPRAERNISHLPDEVSFSAAAALGCRTTTAFRAVVQQGRLVEGEVLAVFGCGGVGLSGALPPAENASLFWSFPYVCPEPVLVNYWQQR
jgi:threonine dehydrogenase-like Zn-dependent dehydrogenase